MEAQGVAFPNLMIQMYRSGEASGNMDKTALTMSNQYSKDHRIKGKNKVSNDVSYYFDCYYNCCFVDCLFSSSSFFLDIFQNVELPLIT